MEGSSSENQPLFAMSGDGTNDVTIPLVFLYHSQGQQLLVTLADNSFLEVILSASQGMTKPQWHPHLSHLFHEQLSAHTFHIYLLPYFH